MVIPTSLTGSFTSPKGQALGDFAYSSICEGQQQSPILGYAPLPSAIVSYDLAQIQRIPGADMTNKDMAHCDNPTIGPAPGYDALQSTAPMPAPCQQADNGPCGIGRRPDAAIRLIPTGAWWFAGTYNSSSAPAVWLTKVGQKRALWVRVQNHALADDRFRLGARFKSSGFSVSWSWHTTNITRPLDTNSERTGEITPGGALYLEAIVTRLWRSTPPPAVLSFTATSIDDPSVSDTLRVTIE